MIANEEDFVFQVWFIKKSARECLGLVPLLQVKGDASFSLVLEVKIFRKLPAYFNFRNETRKN